jgi:hypothetical protein
MRHRRRSNVKIKELNIERNRPNLNKPIRSKTTSHYTQRLRQDTIYAGKTFSLFNHPENVSRIVEEINSYKKRKGYKVIIKLDLSDIENIDLGAISFLLAKVNEMSNYKHVSFWGNFPTHEQCKQRFVESGFLQYMKDFSGKKFEKHGENHLFDVGYEKTSNEQVGMTIKKSMKFLLGDEAHFKPVYSIIQEMCSNSVEWAKGEKSRSKNWLLGVRLDEEDHKSLVFTMTDVGYGILHTLKRKFRDQFRDQVSFANDSVILFQAFEKKYGSKSGKVNRNKGLPLILDRFEKRFIRDLKVITNNVLLNFENNSESRILTKNIPGTAYFWRIDLKCIETWKQQMLN